MESYRIFDAVPVSKCLNSMWPINLLNVCAKKNIIKVIVNYFAQKVPTIILISLSIDIEMKPFMIGIKHKKKQSTAKVN